jgi:hypothetical protein
MASKSRVTIVEAIFIVKDAVSKVQTEQIAKGFGPANQCQCMSHTSSRFTVVVSMTTHRALFAWTQPHTVRCLLGHNSARHMANANDVLVVLVNVW